MCFLLFKKLYGASLIVACGSKCGHDNDVFFSKVYPRLLLIKENKRNNCPLMKLNRLNSHFIVDRFTNTYSVDDCNGYPTFTTNSVANGPTLEMLYYTIVSHFGQNNKLVGKDMTLYARNKP